jgi:putative transposase
MECVGCGSAAVAERSERTPSAGIPPASQAEPWPAPPRVTVGSVVALAASNSTSGVLALSEPDAVPQRRHRPRGALAPALKLALRDLPEMFLIRGIVFSHEAVRNWETKLTPAMAESLRRRRRGKAGRSWYVGETYIKVHGHWRYLYRAIDRSGALVDVMFSEHRDIAAAKAFFAPAKMVTGITPDRVTTDGHDSYPRAIRTTLGAGVRHRGQSLSQQSAGARSSRRQRPLRSDARVQVPTIGRPLLSRLRRVAQFPPFSLPN